MAGTYRIAVCSRTCDEVDPASPAANVLVSLYEQPVREGPLAGATEWVRHAMTMDELDGCIAVSGHTGVSFVGIQDTMITAWKPLEDGRIEIMLYRSPDAGTEAVVSIRNGEMRGVLVDWAAPGRPPRLAGVVRGRRIGPPDPTACGLRRPP